MLVSMYTENITLASLVNQYYYFWEFYLASWHPKRMLIVKSFSIRFIVFPRRQSVGAWASAQANIPTEPLNSAPLLRSPAKATSNDDQHNTSAANTENLFELLERVQSSRLDDQRCVLPAYFSQVKGTTFGKYLYFGVWPPR